MTNVRLRIKQMKLVWLACGQYRHHMLRQDKAGGLDALILRLLVMIHNEICYYHYYSRNCLL